MQVAPTESARGYDRIVLPVPGGGTREMSRREFDALPLLDRIRVLVDGKARFYREGAEIPAHEAVKR